MIKTILVTGATGFIGSYLVERLLDEGYSVLILKRSKSDTWRIKHLLDKVGCYDVDASGIKAAFKENKVDCVIHLATFYKKVHSADDIPVLIDTNIRFPTELMDAMREAGVSFFINAGTLFEYDLSRSPVTEEQAAEPYNLYAATKVAFSDVLKYYSRAYGWRSVDLKLFAPYGPKDNDKLMVFLSRNFLDQKKFSMSPSEQKWNWTYVRDIADAFVASVRFVEEMESKGMDSRYEVFDIGLEDTWSIKEAICMFEDISGVKGLVSFDKPYPDNEIFLASCKNSKAKELLGWAPEYDLKKGIEETYRYYETESKSE